ncbi:PadR family transcriptional regulator [Lactococcus hircilactis]|uniref:PadR family transcriptional regulator n=1 Tax=Lactococcus hircilactis TaxID=1494462 RepID=A0A7X1Z6X5_9LACT|nr:PadR family transcriptional regulator [Lactococcus hircilactis]MQW38825.1 PadR family transcriptional regulator [Lactococcus hircilactis]
MRRNKQSALTETTTYILLGFKHPNHGYGVMKNIAELTHHRVNIAAGTMYGAIENLLKQEWIEEVPGGNARRKLYQLTELGICVIESEMERLEKVLNHSKEIMRGVK